MQHPHFQLRTPPNRRPPHIHYIGHQPTTHMRHVAPRAAETARAERRIAPLSNLVYYSVTWSLVYYTAAVIQSTFVPAALGPQLLRATGGPGCELYSTSNSDCTAYSKIFLYTIYRR